jgi:hypothetical protein
MTMINRDIYNKAPQDNRLVNNGVAEVSEDHSEAAQSILRYELETFVCDGQYEKGIETILDKFLMNLSSKTEQPGVWVSGFYGSGKSHLAKMLRTLWTDYTFADGAAARSIAKLPDGVIEHLKELTTQGKRLGGLHAAAGKLGAGAGDKVRLALLSIIFKSKGLPEQYNQAQFVLWLQKENLVEKLQEELKAVGKTLEQELPHMYVSGHLAKALLKVQPDLGSSEAEVRQVLKAQFPQVTDITSEQMVAAIEETLSNNGKFPLSLVVLDEVQQYIGTDAEKAFQIQEVTETLSKKFNGQLLFVGTGQSALSGMPNLQRLMGRFPVQVMLGDWDVENVTRQIILAKKPSAQPQIETIWRANLGEISRHLRGTKLEHVTEDESQMTSDYPLLPVRRRFWERVLRTIDTTGIVTDHGWLLLPGGLPKSELPKHQAETRWGRCAVLKDSAHGTPLTFGWDWCNDVQVAYAPGVSSFVAGNDYAHGGISFQECWVPFLTLESGTSAVGQAKATIDSVTWRGLRCSVVVSSQSADLRLDTCAWGAWCWLACC